MAEKILIIDDEDTTLELLGILLERKGYEVVKAVRAEEGLRRAYRTQPDLVLLDIMMPDMDGWEVCKRLRELSDVPIIFLTARGETRDIVKGLEMGADDYITKPFNAQELKARIKTHLDLKKSKEKILKQNEELNTLNKELQDLITSRDQFYSIIAHDLRSPFNTILGFLQLILEDFNSMTDEDKYQFINNIYSSAQNLHNLLEKLLSWIRSQTGRLKLNPENFDLNFLVNEILPLYHSGFEKKSITYNFSPTENLIVFINGFYSEEHSKLLPLPEGVRIESLASTLKNDPQFLLKYFGRYVSIDNSFVALNTAMVHDGTVVYVPDNCVLEEPVQILNITASSNQSCVLSQPRNIIVAGKNSQIRIIETYNSLGEEPGFMNVVTEMDVSENAYVELFRIQNENLNSFHISKTQVEQEKGSNFTSYNVTLGGSLVRNDLDTVLDDVNVNANLFGLYILEDTQHVDNHTLIDHAKPHCLSNELYKGVLKDKSRAVFNGKVYVRKDAQKTNAYQSNKNILLSEEATVDTKPQLEIFADDVRCTHGATVGQLDEESVFYLRSRGIDEQNARSILIRAFANDIFEEIKQDALKEHLNNLVFEKLK
ncbi:MAG: Fe-S cluster assembly protein SufD [candidate division WOR-3 bacterium]